MREDQIRSLLDEVIESARRARDAEVDAACCQTRGDWDRLRKAAEEHEGVYQRAVEALARL